MNNELFQWLKDNFENHNYTGPKCKGDKGKVEFTIQDILFEIPVTEETNPIEFQVLIFEYRIKKMEGEIILYENELARLKDNLKSLKLANKIVQSAKETAEQEFYK